MLNRQDEFESQFFLKTGKGIYFMWAPQPCSIGPEQMSRRFGMHSQIREDLRTLVYHANLNHRNSATSRGFGKSTTAELWKNHFGFLALQ